MTVDYDGAFHALAGVYLEDSWVLEVAPSHDGLALRLETVLKAEHPLYEAPAAGERHCYRNAWLDVRSADPVEVELSGARPAVDASGTEDVGNIDRFAVDERVGLWVLEGGWGIAKFRDPSVSLHFD